MGWNCLGSSSKSKTGAQTEAATGLELLPNGASQDRSTHGRGVRARRFLTEKGPAASLAGSWWDPAGNTTATILTGCREPFHEVLELPRSLPLPLATDDVVQAAWHQEGSPWRQAEISSPAQAALCAAKGIPCHCSKRRPATPEGPARGNCPSPRPLCLSRSWERPAMALGMLEDKWLGNGALLPLRSRALACCPGQTETQGAAPFPQLHLKYLS